MTTETRDFHELFGSYQPIAQVYNEVADSEGLREPYGQLIKSLDRMGRSEFSRRWQQAKRTVRDNGIAYSADSDDTRPRFWNLDPIPLLIPSQEWDQVKTAVQQRARMLQLLLADLYGPQNLLKKGVIPAELVYSDPGFCRSYVTLEDTQKIADRYLHIYACDIARAPNGKWWIIADRTEAPSGLGYTLEHRIVSSQMLPDIFRTSNTRRLASFFAAMQNRLDSIVAHNRDHPHIVLLSDGPTNPYHLEDSYLSRYLGYLLVQDGDLTVRRGKVMLKTLGGLQPIDAVLRHQNTSDCDPLTHNTVAGVAGLTQAYRDGQVAIANPPGSGLVESPAYMAYSIQLCKALLNEELLLPNVATWWCGEPTSCKFVLQNLDRVHVEPAFRDRGNDEDRRLNLYEMPKEELASRIEASPQDFVAKEIVQRSCVPLWGPQLRPGHIAVRSYAVSTCDGKSFEVMDGGLGRVSDAIEPLEISIRKGERSKDVWIQSEVPVAQITLLSDRGQPLVVRRSGAELPSRVADNLFWLGRRLERTEDHARMIGITAQRLIGELPYSELRDIDLLLRCLAAQGLIEPGYAMPNLRDSLPNISLQLANSIFANQPDSLATGVQNLVRLGSLVRDRLSVHAWKVIQQLDSEFRERSGHLNLADVVEVMDQLQILLSALTGIVIEGMTRTQIFQFVDLGRRIERSQQILSILNEGILSTAKPARREYETTLELMQSLMTYRSRYLANVHEPGVIDLVVTDEKNPRSLAYQFMRMSNHIDQLPRIQNVQGLGPEQRAAMNLLNDVRNLDASTAPEIRGDESVFQRMDNDVLALANSLSHRYLVHAKSRHLSEHSKK